MTDRVPDPHELKRVGFQKTLKGLVGPTVEVYFQAPSNTKMQYPCILFERTEISSSYSDNRRYRTDDKYKVTYVDTKADNSVVHLLLQLPYSDFDRRFVSGNLYHDVLTIYI